MADHQNVFRSIDCATATSEQGDKDSVARDPTCYSTQEASQLISCAHGKLDLIESRRKQWSRSAQRRGFRHPIPWPLSVVHLASTNRLPSFPHLDLLRQTSLLLNPLSQSFGLFPKRSGSRVPALKPAFGRPGFCHSYCVPMLRSWLLVGRVLVLIRPGWSSFPLGARCGTES